jgi:hypothetical protein
MSFPATYNIQYYMGDTFEFRIFPKDASGAPFPLAQFSNVRFTIAEKRGPLLSTDNPRITGFAAISEDRTSILCSIRPSDAANLDANTQYVYDVEISRTATPYDQVFTLLTGNISITDQVTPVIPPPPPPLTAPGPAVSPTVSSVTTSSIVLGWQSPTTGGAPDGYRLYIAPYDPSFENTQILNQLVGLLSTLNPFEETGNTFSFVSTTEIPAFNIPSLPILPGTAYIYAIVAYNEAGISAAVGNFNVAAGTVEEVFTATEPDFVITNDGTGAYLIDGVSNDTITLVRGQSYTFSINASGHPFWIQESPSPYDEYSVYNTGINNNGEDVGTITWTVDESAPNTLYYVCQFHESMQGIINIIDGGS